MLRLLIAAVMVWLAGVLRAATPITSTSAMGPAPDERTLLTAANGERARQRVAPLRWDEALAKAARQHAQRMAREYAISHQFPGEPDVEQRALEAGARFQQLAENVGQGATLESVETAWMHSPGHRANLLNATFDSAGIGIARWGGQYFVTEDFSRAIPWLTLVEQEQRLGALLVARGLHLLGAAEDARRVCAAANAFAAPAHVSLEMSFTTHDLSRLPQELERDIRQGQYHAAAVGACSGGEGTRTGMYRLAVLLY